MKSIYATALIGLFLLFGAVKVTAQTVTEEQKPTRQERLQDLANTVEISLTINNVNYTDIYDRSILMKASKSNCCRFLLDC